MCLYKDKQIHTKKPRNWTTVFNNSRFGLSYSFQGTSKSSQMFLTYRCYDWCSKIWAFNDICSISSSSKPSLMILNREFMKKCSKSIAKTSFFKQKSITNLYNCNVDVFFRKQRKSYPSENLTKWNIYIYIYKKQERKLCKGSRIFRIRSYRLISNLKMTQRAIFLLDRLIKDGFNWVENIIESGCGDRISITGHTFFDTQNMWAEAQ